MNDSTPRRDSLTNVEETGSTTTPDIKMKPDHGNGREPPNNSAGSGKTRRRIRLFFLVLLGCLLLLFLAGFLPRYFRTRKIQQQAEQNKNTPPTVVVTPVKRAPDQTRLSIPGTTAPLVEAYIYARASGYVKNRYVDIGDHVRQGQLLAVIDAPEVDHEVDQARANLLQSQSAVGQADANLQLAQVTWDRYRVLVSRGVLSRQDGDTQHATYVVAQANLAAAQNTVAANRAELNRLLQLQAYEQVVAPFDGVITARNIDVGTLISATGSGLGSAVNNNSAAIPPTGLAQGGQMFQIAQTNRMRSFISVPEAFAPFIKTGGHAQVSVTATPGQVFDGTVTRTTRAIEQSTRTLLTEVQIRNPENRLLPGTYVLVTFTNVQAPPPLLVPADSLITRGTGTKVAIVQNNIVHIRNVTVGRDYGAQIAIVSGVEEGDLVVVNVSDAVREGAKVIARQETQGAGGPA